MATSSSYTRSKSRHSVFGHPKELSKSVLPTCEDICRAYCHYQQSEECKSISDIPKAVAAEVNEIYARASIPTIEFDSIVKKVKRLVEKGYDLRKYPESKRSSKTYQESLSGFIKLFDICSCKCFDNGIRDRKDCTCPLASKIPPIEWDFWIDQKTSRKMIIGKLDPMVTSKLQKQEERKLKADAFIRESRKRMAECSIISEEMDYSSDEEIDSNNTDVEFTGEQSDDNDSTESEEGAQQNRHQFPELCKAVDRANVSNRDACLIANAVLKDLGILSPQNALHPSKLRRQRTAWRNKSAAAHEDENQRIVCLGFDGKIDVTLTKTGSICRKTREEHYVLVAFPCRSYAEHVVPSSGKADDISREILSFVRSSNSEATLSAVVCDGTAVNTGQYNGVIRQLEVSLQRPLQWLICLLHANELPLRKLMEVVDGKTTGPKTSEGQIAKMLQFDPQLKPIIEFAPVPGRVSEIEESVMKDLSTDQLYLLRICLLIQRGFSASDNYISYLQTAQPGAISHARWLTKANRLLRLYACQERPSDNLLRIVRFILNFYAPIWFHIKSRPNCQEGAKNFFYIVSLYQKLDRADQIVVAPVLQNNNYFCHPENILLAAVSDSDENIRKFAFDKILIARSSHSVERIRCFDKNKIKLDFSATSYLDMIDWENAQFDSPPLLNDFTSETFAINPQINLPYYPCHSQDVERSIKDVSAVCGKVYGHASRHGVIIQTKKSRSELPTIETKADFL